MSVARRHLARGFSFAGLNSNPFVISRTEGPVFAHAKFFSSPPRSLMKRTSPAVLDIGIPRCLLATLIALGLRLLILTSLIHDAYRQPTVLRLQGSFCVAEQPFNDPTVPILRQGPNVFRAFVNQLRRLVSTKSHEVCQVSQTGHPHPRNS